MTFAGESSRLFWRIAGCVVGTIALASCSSTSMDESGAEVNSGIAQARQGIALVRSGTGKADAGTTEIGLADVDTGMGKMSDGTTKIESGMHMMSGGMMSHCSMSADNVVNPMRNANQRVRDGRAMLMDPDSSNDAEAISNMLEGCQAMSDALDSAETGMNCMGHHSMSSMM